MNLCKFMQEQGKSTNATWSSACGEGGFHIRFVGTKKCPSESEELNTIFSLTVAKALRTNKNPKANTTEKTESEDDLNHFNLKS